MALIQDMNLLQRRLYEEAVKVPQSEVHTFAAIARRALERDQDAAPRTRFMRHPRTDRDSFTKRTHVRISYAFTPRIPPRPRARER